MEDATKQGFGSDSHSPFFTEEHEMLRDQLRRFVEEEIKPFGDAWEKQGFVPRDVLRRMGTLGFFGIRYPEVYGGSAMDTLGSVVFAEELGRSLLPVFDSPSGLPRYSAPMGKGYALSSRPLTRH